MILKKLNYLLLLVAVGLITFTGCKEDDDEEVNVISDTEFMQFAAVSGLFEIQSSNLAINKATTPDVVDFANQMIADHTVQARELDSLALAKNVTLPKVLTADKQAIINRLQGESGTVFEKDYMNAQVTSHDETIARFEQASKIANDKDVRAFATKYLPALQMHREHAGEVKTVTDALQ